MKGESKERNQQGFHTEQDPQEDAQNTVQDLMKNGISCPHGHQIGFRVALDVYRKAAWLAGETAQQAKGPKTPKVAAKPDN